MPAHTFIVHAEWDQEAEVWFVADSDVPGLAAEAATTEALLDKLRVLVPELVEMNRHLIAFDIAPGMPIHLMSERTERMVEHRGGPTRQG